MKLTEKQIARMNEVRVNEYGHTIRPTIPKSYVERASGGAVSTSVWRDPSGGYVEVYLRIYAPELATKAQRHQFNRNNPGKLAGSFYDDGRGGRTVAEAKRDVFLETIRHFTSKEVEA